MFLCCQCVTTRNFMPQTLTQEHASGNRTACCSPESRSSILEQHKDIGTLSKCNALRQSVTPAGSGCSGVSLSSLPLTCPPPPTGVCLYFFVQQWTLNVPLPRTTLCLDCRPLLCWSPFSLQAFGGSMLGQGLCTPMSRGFRVPANYPGCRQPRAVDSARAHLDSAGQP